MILRINDRIRNKKIDFFNDIDITLKYDAVASVFNFHFHFDPTKQEHIDLACIGHYHLCTIEHLGQTVMTGIIMAQHFHDEKTPEMLTLSGYSLGGVLEDCEIPPEAYPLQTDMLSLKEITDRIIKPFGLKYVIDSSVTSKMNEKYDEASATPGQSVKSFLSELASQKNIILSHDTQGRLKFTRPSPTQKPIASFERGKGLYTSMQSTFDGQAMHSRIFVVNQADMDDINTAESYADNPFVIKPVFRQKVMVINSGNKLDAINMSGPGSAARNALSQELRNYTLTIHTDRWDVKGRLFMPGDVVTVLNPYVYNFTKTRWMIEEIHLKGNEKAQTASLKCVMPAVFDGSTPVYP